MLVDTRSTIVHIIVHSTMYVLLLLLLCLQYVQMYIVPADTTVAALPSSTHNWGPERSPFIQPCGASYFFDSGQEQERLYFFGPRVHL